MKHIFARTLLLSYLFFTPCFANKSFIAQSVYEVAKLCSEIDTDNAVRYEALLDFINNESNGDRFKYCFDIADIFMSTVEAQEDYTIQEFACDHKLSTTPETCPTCNRTHCLVCHCAEHRPLVCRAMGFHIILTALLKELIALVPSTKHESGIIYEYHRKLVRHSHRMLAMYVDLDTIKTLRSAPSDQNNVEDEVEANGFEHACHLPLDARIHQILTRTTSDEEHI